MPPLVPPIVFGVDLGSGQAMSAIAAYSPKSRVLKVLAAFPSSPGLSERGAKDSVGNLYQDMHARGELLLLGNRVVDTSQLVRAAKARFGRPSVVVSDRFRSLRNCATAWIRQACRSANL